MASESQHRWNNGRQQPPPVFRKPKLMTAQYEEIRQRLADGEDDKALALEYGVSARRIREFR
jgi:DNA-binding NarL/FixJ family response regulator